MSKIGDISTVVSPPYDVINPEMQRDLYERSPYNFVRVDLARDPGEMRYSEAKRVFDSWLKDEVLIGEENPSFYFHEHSFRQPGGRIMTRRGFFGLRRLEDFSQRGIRPHERTLRGPKEDRLKLTRAVCAQLSPVFSLYSDPNFEVDHLVARLKAQRADIAYKTEDGSRHQLWIESNPTVCQFIGRFFVGRALLIADGHHRYETALNYKSECTERSGDDAMGGPFDYVLMYFSNMSDQGLVILPIHRAVHSLQGFDPVSFLRRLEVYFKITSIGKLKEEDYIKKLHAEGDGAHSIVLLTQDPEKSYLLSMSKRSWRESPVAATIPAALVGLDVTLLHRLVFEEILRISAEAQERQENILYFKDTKQAIEETWRGNCQLTFLLNATHIEEMEKVTLAGEVMPQKSTFFYPKVPSGLVMYSLKG